MSTSVLPFLWSSQCEILAQPAAILQSQLREYRLPAHLQRLNIVHCLTLSTTLKIFFNGVSQSVCVKMSRDRSRNRGGFQHRGRGGMGMRGGMGNPTFRNQNQHPYQNRGAHMGGGFKPNQGNQPNQASTPQKPQESNQNKPAVQSPPVQGPGLAQQSNNQGPGLAQQSNNQGPGLALQSNNQGPSPQQTASPALPEDPVSTAAECRQDPGPWFPTEPA